jgi:hypothetical protein
MACLHMNSQRSIPILAVLLLWPAACGDVKAGPVDSEQDNGIDPADDGLDMAPDRPGDTGTDVTSPDAPEDTPTETPPTACEDEGGTCTTYTTETSPCVTCPDTYLPAPGPDGARGCTSGGEGVAPWCCMPAPADPPECVSGGGGCYPRGGGGRCPVGWVRNDTMACNGREVCCVPGDSCS